MTSGSANETDEHKSLKTLLNSKFVSWFGVSLTEYPLDGQEADVFTVTYQGIKIMIEVVWTATTTNLLRDLVLIHRAQSKIKILVFNPEILRKASFRREIDKSMLAELKQGIIVSAPVDGKKLLEDPDYVDTEFRLMVKSLVSSANSNGDESRPRSAAVVMEDCEDGTVEDIYAKGDLDAAVSDRRGRRNKIRRVKLDK